MTPFTSDMTLRWPCRAGDYILWARFQDIGAGAGIEYTIADVWELADGNFVTLTNRAPDLPTWFELHPLEASGRNVAWMKRKLAGGYRPDGAVEGPNLWRVFAGDRLAWVGARRAGVVWADGVLRWSSSARTRGYAASLSPRCLGSAGLRPASHRPRPQDCATRAGRRCSKPVLRESRRRIPIGALADRPVYRWPNVPFALPVPGVA
jgi:hypothetical protein